MSYIDSTTGLIVEARVEENNGKTVPEVLTREIMGSYRRIMVAYNTLIASTNSPFNQFKNIVDDVSSTPEEYDNIKYSEAHSLEKDMIYQISIILSATTLYNSLLDCEVLPDLSNLNTVLSSVYNQENVIISLNIINQSISILETISSTFGFSRLQQSRDYFNTVSDSISSAASSITPLKGSN